MRHTILAAIALFSVLTVQAQDTTLFSDDTHVTVDEQINESVAPFTKVVEDIVFFSLPIKKELVFNEVIRLATPKDPGFSRFTKEAPYTVNYEKENIPVNKFFIIDYVDEESYILRYRFTEEDNDQYTVSNTYNFNEQVTIDGFTFAVEKLEPGPINERYKFKVGQISVPFVLVWLIVGAIIFTIYFRFINFGCHDWSIFVTATIQPATPAA